MNTIIPEVGKPNNFEIYDTFNGEVLASCETELRAKQVMAWILKADSRYTSQLIVRPSPHVAASQSTEPATTWGAEMHNILGQASKKDLLTLRDKLLEINPLPKFDVNILQTEFCLMFPTDGDVVNMQRAQRMAKLIRTFSTEPRLIPLDHETIYAKINDYAKVKPIVSGSDELRFLCEEIWGLRFGTPANNLVPLNEKAIAVYAAKILSEWWNAEEDSDSDFDFTKSGREIAKYICNHFGSLPSPTTLTEEERERVETVRMLAQDEARRHQLPVIWGDILTVCKLAERAGSSK